MKRRMILALLLSCMLTGIFSINTSASVVASGSCGSNLKWEFDSSGVLTISGSGSMNNYTQNSNPGWYSYRSDITSVVIEPGVTTVGDYAVIRCGNLKSVSIPDTVTRLGESAFALSGLTSVTIPKGVTSLSDTPFSGSDKMTEIRVVNDNPSFCSVDGVLFSKDKKALVEFPGGKAGSYTIPNTVTNIKGGAFLWCILSDITVPSNVRNIGEYAFQHCLSLTTLHLNSGLETIGNYAFSQCENLNTVSIPNTVSSFGEYAFWDSAIEQLTIPDSVVNIEHGAFKDCSRLKNVYFKGNAPTIGDNAFLSCSLTAYYNPTKKNWNNVVGKNYGGTIAWKVSAADIAECSIKVATGNYVYNGKEHTPQVTIKNNNDTLIEDKDYYIDYTNNVNAGTGKIIIRGINNYSGTITKTFTINKASNTVVVSDIKKTVSSSTQTVKLSPSAKGNGAFSYTSSNPDKISVNNDGTVKIKAKYIGNVIITVTVQEKGNYASASKKINVTVVPGKTKLSTLRSKKKKKLTITWKKNSYATGYEIYCSTSKTFSKNVKANTIPKAKTVKITVSGLSSKKNYYIKIRAYKTVNGVKYYGDWSSTKGTKIK